MNNDQFTYETATEYILEIPKFSKKTSHDNLKFLMELLGNPQERVPVIHVAGTNGKGSVCAFLSSILQEAGYDTGMFTSPHLVRMNERIKRNGVDISDGEFLELFLAVKTQVDFMMDKGYDHPSFFEFLFAMAALYFAWQKVDFAVFEVGLGGRLDATNIIRKPVVSVITSISLDHTEILGDTLEKIAAEKAGIIKPQVPLVYLDKQKEVSVVIQDKFKKCGNDANDAKAISKDFFNIIKNNRDCIDFFVGNGYYDKCTFSVPFPAEYQCENASLAIGVIEVLNRYLEKSGSLPIPYEKVLDGILHVKWEGRMEQIEKDIYLDGGHNEDGIRAFIKSAGRIAGKREILLLFAAVREKNYEKMIKNICENLPVSVIIITDIPGARCLAMQKMKECFEKYSEAQIILEEDHEKAFALGRKKKEDRVMFCVGSLYLIGSLKEIMDGENSMNF